MVLDNVIHASAHARQAVDLLSKSGAGSYSVLFVLGPEQQVVGTLSDSDIRKGSENGHSLDETVEVFLNPDFFYLESDSYHPGLLEKSPYSLVPVLDSQGKLARILDTETTIALLPVHPILMAGGRGSRLSPLTEELPKPLLKVGEKTLLEHNLDRLARYGMDFFHVAVHYLAHKVSDLLGDGSDRNVVIRYVMEDQPLGTIGALGLIPEFRHSHLLVMNADLLTTLDFEGFYQDFLREDADLAIATRSYSISLPFGVLEVEGHNVLGIREKPNYTYPINAGIYLLKRELADLVPEHKPFDATDLIEAALHAKKRVITFPLLDYWLDIGNPEDYERAQRDIQYLKL